MGNSNLRKQVQENARTLDRNTMNKNMRKKLQGQQQYLQQTAISNRNRLQPIKIIHHRQMSKQKYKEIQRNRSNSYFLKLNLPYKCKGSQKLGIDLLKIKGNIQEGSTIVSMPSYNGQQERYMIHFRKFKDQESYTKYTDTLIYRLKLMHSVNKIKNINKYLTKIIAIYGQKVQICSDCGSGCKGVYHSYVIEQHFQTNLKDVLQDELTVNNQQKKEQAQKQNNNISCQQQIVCYQKFFSIVESLSKVMSAYQYKRLRFGLIDLSKIYILKYKKQDKANDYESNRDVISSFTLQNQSQNHTPYKSLKKNSHGKKQLQNLNIETKQQKIQYICKVSDPYIISFDLPASNSGKQQNFVDVYKNDVYQVGLTLQKVLNKRKQIFGQQNQQVYGTLQLSQNQLKYKQFLQNFVKKYMTCQIYDRYNWLQIQRHFQQFNYNRNIEQGGHLMRSISPNTQIQHFRPTSAYQKSNSMEKPFTSNESPRYQIPNIFKNIPLQKQQKSIPQINKQNVQNQNCTYRCLKPLNRMKSKQNLTMYGAPILTTQTSIDTNKSINFRPTETVSKPRSVSPIIPSAIPVVSKIVSPLKTPTFPHNQISNSILNNSYTVNNSILPPQPSPSITASLNPFSATQFSNTFTDRAHIPPQIATTMQTPRLISPTIINQTFSVSSNNSKNSGYGVVENSQPQLLHNNKIKYDNLYNIAKFWTKFQGNFVNGSKQGPGTIYLTNGHIFSGVFQKDLANGKGSVYIDGEVVLKGTWSNNILVSEF